MLRPGPLQYAYLLLFPAIFVLIGLLIIGYGFQADPPEWSNRIFGCIPFFGLGLIWAAFVLGMSIEIDDLSVRKRRLFGALDSRPIPLDSLQASAETEHSSDWSYTRIDFTSDKDKWAAFSVYPFWVWRTKDIDYIRTQAAKAQSAQVAKLPRGRPGRSKDPARELHNRRLAEWEARERLRKSDEAHPPT
jgi:hypothetical protein